MTKFETSRTDGRSDSDVIVDVVSSVQPGELITYEILIGALSNGCGRQFERRDVCAAVNRASLQISKRTKRCLRCVRGMGYRVAEAREHQAIALWRKDRADVQMRRGLQALQHVDLSAMDENSRRAHEGQLMLMSAMMMQQKSLERRQASLEALVNGLIAKQQ